MAFWNNKIIKTTTDKTSPTLNMVHGLQIQNYFYYPELNYEIETKLLQQFPNRTISISS